MPVELIKEEVVQKIWSSYSEQNKNILPSHISWIDYRIQHIRLLLCSQATGYLTTPVDCAETTGAAHLISHCVCVLTVSKWYLSCTKTCTPRGGNTLSLTKMLHVNRARKWSWIAKQSLFGKPAATQKYHVREIAWDPKIPHRVVQEHWSCKQSFGSTVVVGDCDSSMNGWYWFQAWTVKWHLMRICFCKYILGNHITILQACFFESTIWWWQPLLKGQPMAMWFTLYHGEHRCLAVTTLGWQPGSTGTPHPCQVAATRHWKACTWA